MRFLLENLLHLDMFEGSRIIASAQNIRNSINGISIVDQMFEIQEMKRGSMIYLPMAPNGDMDGDIFFKELQESGIGAICIKSRYEKQVSEKFMSQAESSGLPLILLPDDFDFSNAVDIFLSHIFCRNTEEFIHQDNLHLMYNIRYSKYGVKGVIRCLHELSGLPVISLVNKERHAFGEMDVDGSLDLTNLWQQADDIQLQKDTFTYDFRVRRCLIPENGKYLYMARSSYKGIEGYIGILYDQDKLSDSDSSLMGFTAYWSNLIHKRTYYAVVQSLSDQRNFLKKLLRGRYSSWDEAAKAAKILEWDLPHSIQVITIDYQMEDIVGLLEAVRGQFFDLDNKIPFVSEFKGKILIVHGNTLENVSEDIGLIIGRLRKKFRNTGFFTGIGGTVAFERIPDSYQQSLQASSLAASLGIAAVTFQDMGVLRLFADSLHNTEVQGFYKDYYTPIKNFDEKHDSELRYTLRCYLDSGCNYSETAKKLFLHYNTVRYRIGMIEKLCNVDMKTQDGLINMGVALKLSELIETNEVG